MGSASSKLRKLIFQGDEYAALQVIQNSPELRRSLDPNLGYGEHHQHNTAIHYASKHGMKHLLRMFLTELFGNPNKQNSQNETALHLACQLPVNASPAVQDRKVACVQLILQWKGCFPSLVGGIELVDIKVQDLNGNTALHTAAGSGMKHVVELLVSHSAPLFLENNERLTPCDVAMKANFHDIALFLESRMVFADIPTEMNSNLSESSHSQVFYGTGDTEEIYTGLRAQDLQEAKDQLVVETADMLHVPLFTAEALLRENEWSREILLEKWMRDPILCCETVGLQTPISALWINQPTKDSQESCEYLESSSRIVNKVENNLEDSCGICLDEMDQGPSRVVTVCKHSFCRRCWTSYLTYKITEGNGHDVTCPALGCCMLIPVELIESLVTKETARKYLHFDLNSFVATNPTIKWCPKPGCGRAVRLPHKQQSQPNVLNILSSSKEVGRTSHAVDCGSGHFFCWECLKEAHAPSGCDQWLQWLHKVVTIKPEELKTTCTESEEAANCYWLVSNCKACPSCKSLIQKNEGCNHMKCCKCKFDFCWVCLDAWKKHSSATGGYFRCNRYEAMLKADEKQGSLISEAGQRNKHLQELNRFIHYYTRYKNHENSRLMEEPLLTSSQRKMELLAASLPAGRSPVLCHSAGFKELTTNQVPACTRFIEEGIRELIKARRILCGSYVYGYYLEDNGYNKTIFEFMQSELESFTEKLSEMVARPYLRTPRSIIAEMTSKVRRKRHEFMRAVSKGLIPPETPPALRRVRRRRFPALMGIDPVEDDQITEAIAASLRHLDPNNPWVKDSQGRHTNLSAIYDWPDANSDEEDSDVNQALTVSLLGVCEREGCGRPRARNPRTGKVHPFCSLRCNRFEGSGQPIAAVTTTDFAMDLVIALEMSRLQLIEDQMRKQCRSGDQAGSSSSEGRERQAVDEFSEDAQLRLAIHLSLEESRLKPQDVNCAKTQLKNLTSNSVTSTQDLKSSKTLFDEGSSHGESEGRFKISDLHQNDRLFSSSLDGDPQMDTVSDSAVSLLPFPRRSHSACDIHSDVTFRCQSLELESHDCLNDLVENISRGPVTRTVLRLQSLGTDYGSDDLGVESSEEAVGAQLKEVTPPSNDGHDKPKLMRQACLSEQGSFNFENTLPTPTDEQSCDQQGIPRSPTLFISGVTISRTPEPPEVHDSAHLPIGLMAPTGAARTGRSSSLTTAVIASDAPQISAVQLQRGLSRSAGRLNRTSFVMNSGTKSKRKDVVRIQTLPSLPSASENRSPIPIPSPNFISRSACEPTREKEIFLFPKSPTGGDLKTVLLVSEDDDKCDGFHESLFLPRSPRTAEHKRKRIKTPGIEDKRIELKTISSQESSVL